MHHKNRKDKELLCGGTEARNHLAGPSSRWGIKGPSRPPPGHLWPWNSPSFAPHKFGAVQSAPTRAARLTLGWHGRREPEQRCPRAGDAPPPSPLPLQAAAPRPRTHPPLPRRYLAIPAGRRPGAARTLQPGTAIAKEPADDSHLSGLPVPSQAGSRGHRRRAAAALPEPREPPQRQATITAAATAETLRRGLRAPGAAPAKSLAGGAAPRPRPGPAPRARTPSSPRRPRRAHRARAREGARESEPLGRARAQRPGWCLG